MKTALTQKPDGIESGKRFHLVVFCIYNKLAISTALSNNYRNKAFIFGRIQKKTLRVNVSSSYRRSGIRIEYIPNSPKFLLRVSIRHCCHAHLFFLLYIVSLFFLVI